MTEREKILARVREALAVHVPAGHNGDGAESGKLKTAGDARQWLPIVAESSAERIAQFERNALDLKAEFQVLGSLDEVRSRLKSMAQTAGWKRIGAHGGELVDAVIKDLGLPICPTDKPYSAQELEQCEAAVTECDALVAQTGSVLITSRSAGGRGLSVLPPHHIVLARRDQLVADLPDAFALLKRKYGANYPSFISFITGPSRTGDIERILVLGAHGPKKLTIFMV